MKYSRINALNVSLFLAAALLLTGCGGTKILKEPVPFTHTESLALGSDERLNAIVDWVIVRDGPGTWARNADWDEYLIRVENPGSEPIRIESITVVDSLGFRVDARNDRKQLVRGTKETKRRYKGDGIKVKAGMSGAMIVGAGAATYAVALPSAYAAGMSGAALGAGAAVAVVAAPIVLAAGGITRGVRNSKVNAEIIRRQAKFPIELPIGETQAVHVFFPLAPSPQKVQIVYSDAKGEHTLVIDTRAELEGLHLEQAEE